MEISKKELDLIIRSTPGDVVIYKLAERTAIPIYASSRMPSYSGFSAEEYKNQLTGNALDRVFPSDRELVITKTREAYNQGADLDYTYRIIHKAKGIVWVHVRARGLGTMDGARLLLTEFYNLSDDVDGYAEMINHSKNIVYVIDENSHELFYANTMATKFFGHTDYAGKQCYEFARGRTAPCPWCIINKLTGMSASEKGFVDSEIGIIIDVDAMRIKWFDRNAIFIYVHDVTEQTKQRVQEQTQYQRTIQELLLANPQAICGFRLNLTLDTCDESHGTSSYIQTLLSADTATGMIGNIVSIIPNKKDAQKFSETISRRQLLDDYANGIRHKEMRYERLNEYGDERWVNTYINLLQNPDTNDIEAIFYSIDVTHEIEEEMVVSAITKNTYDYIAIIDVKTHHLRVLNIRSYESKSRPATESTYDDSLVETYKKYPSVSTGEDFLKSLSFSNIIEKLEHQENFNYSFLMVDATGRTYRKQMVYRYLDKSRKKILFVCMDVTTAFLAEQEQAEQIQEALLVAEHASDMKTSFLSNVSHDMRTPLNAILGYVSLAKKSDNQDLKNDFLNKIGIAGDTLLALINDTLDLQKIENGVITLKPERIKTDEMIEQIVDSVQSLLDEKHIQFKFDDSQTTHSDIMADSVRLKQIFINLISNAIKFTPDGGKVELIAECLEMKDGIIHDKFIVRDTGIGMSQEFLPKIFEPFSQERTTETAHIGGSGLGLAIVKRIITLMGGTIEVKSELGRGSEFFVWLDFLQPTEAETAEEKHTVDMEKLKGRHILICEDNEMNTEIAKLMLENAGITVTCVNNGMKGMEIYCASSAGTYDAILMDIRMPVMNGYEATRAIRESTHPQAKTVPIIALSADAYDADVKRSLDAGMNAHIGKPINPAQLYEVIAIYCT